MAEGKGDPRPRLTRRDFLAASLGAALLPAMARPGTASAVPTGAFGVRDRHRVIVSTDIGGTDPDDFQSMVHLLVYADSLDLEGLISSPYGPGRKRHILEVLDHYETDYPNLRSHSVGYPEPEKVRAITKQGAIDVADHRGYGRSTEGSEWIVHCARRADPRPLHVLVWGGIEDLAQALHDAPEILPKLGVYFVGGPNKKWSVDAYHYIATHHPELFIIEANSTYRGWFVGGNQAGQWDNREFVSRHIAGRGALGDFFASQLDGTVKMGDSPAVGWLLHGTPADPTQPGWGGRFVRAWERPYSRFERLTSREDRIEHFAVMELALRVGDGAPPRPEARMEIENQSLVGHLEGPGVIRFRFSPKDAKTYTYTIRSDAPLLDGQTGEVRAVQPPPEAAARPAPRWPNWWTDDPTPELAEGPHQGTRTVSRWREQFLSDFAARMLRCASAAGSEGSAAPRAPPRIRPGWRLAGG